MGLALEVITPYKEHKRSSKYFVPTTRTTTTYSGQLVIQAIATAAVDNETDGSQHSNHSNGDSSE
jgi:hypothetical protein